MPPPGRRGGKFSKPTRGGGKHFSRDLQPLDKDGNAMGMWRDPADKQDSDEEEEEEESEEESEDEDADGKDPVDESNLSREQRKELARQRKAAAIAKKSKKVAEVGDLPTSSEDEEDEDEDEDMPANPNHSSKARAQARIVTAPSAETPVPAKKTDKGQLSRREREAIEAQAAKERYEKLHAEGKTDQARADLERLKLVRQQREEAAARKKAETEEREAERQEREAEIEAREKKLREAAMGGPKKGGKKGTKK